MIIQKYIKIFKSLLILPTCLLVLTSCGKEFKNSEDSEEVGKTSELVKNLSFEFSFTGDAQLKSKNFMFTEGALVTLPEKIYIKSGKPQDYKIRVYFNSNYSPDQRSAEEEYYCTYTSSKEILENEIPDENGYYHKFDGCLQDVDEDGELDYLEYNVGEQVFQNKGMYMRLDLIKGFSDETAEVFTEFQIKSF